jgi:hypothetical protein
LTLINMLMAVESTEWEYHCAHEFGFRIFYIFVPSL